MLLLAGRKGSVPGCLSCTWMPYSAIKGYWLDVFREYPACEARISSSADASLAATEQQIEKPLNERLQRSAMAYSAHDPFPWKEALSRLKQPGVIADVSTYASMLRSCGDSKALSDGKYGHRLIVESGFEQNVYLANLVLQMYGHCGALRDAHALFANLQSKDQFSWNFMITAYARHWKGREALQLFDQMLSGGDIPDKFTFPSVLSACIRQADLAYGRKIHGYIKDSGLEADPIVSNALISMYGKCGSLEDAQGMFDKIAERDIVSWNAMISVYTQHGQLMEAFHFFKNMQLEGVRPNKITFISIVSALGNRTNLAEGKYIHAEATKSGFEADLVVGNALVSMYGKCGSLEDAHMLFEKMPERDLVSWNAIITAHAQLGQSKDHLQLFCEMQQEGMTPNNATFSSIVSGCANHAALSDGKRLHACVIYTALASDVFVMSALVTMYCKCGSLQEAQSMFDMMQKRDVFSWNDMIAAYAQQGKGLKALKLFHQMQREASMPDKFIFASVLSACTDPKAFPEAKRLHTSVIGSGFESDDAVGTALMASVAA